MKAPSIDPHRRLIILIITFVSMAVLIGLIVLERLQRDLLHRSGETLAMAAVAMTDKLDRIFFERYGDIHMLARAFASQMTTPHQLTGYLRWMQETYHVYRWLGVCDEMGRVIAATDPATIGQDRSMMPWFQAAKRDGRVTIGDVTGHAEINGHLAASFAAPVTDATGRFRGVVVSLVGLPVVQDIVQATEDLLRAELDLPSSFEYIVVTRKGDVIVDSMLRQEGQVNVSADASVQKVMSSGTPGYMEEESIRRHRPIVTGYARTRGYQEFPGFGWGVLVRVPRADVLAPIDRLIVIVSLAGLAVLLPLFGLLWFAAVRLRATDRELRHAHAELEARVESRTAELRDSERRLQLAQQVTNSGTWDWDPVKNEAMWSEGTWAVFGLTANKQPVTLQLWESCLHPDDRARAVTAVSMALQEAQDYSDQYQIVTPTGTTEWIESHARILRDGAGAPVRMLGIVLRITERKRTEQALKQLNASLERQVKERTAALLEKQEQLRSLASELTRSEERERKSLAAKLHDNLAQSLALCKMKLEIAQHTEATPSKILAESKELVNEALSATRNMMSDLRPPLLGAADDLSTAVSWVVKKLARHGLHVTVQDDRHPKMLGEEILTVTYQAIQELLFNVLKHAQTKEAMLVLERVDDHLQVMVMDRGVGFDPSRRLTPGEDGGFGLFNIRERIELVGGALEITSATSAGTCVTFTVPLATSLFLSGSGEASADLLFPAKTVDKQEGGESGSSNIRIVLVDDHRMMRQGLRSVLEEQGQMEVIGEASDGAMAVDVTRRLRPDVVIMDINMPGMNGLEATRRIKTEFPEVTVIALSMHKDEKMVEAMRVAGASAYISKAQVFEALCAAIRQHARKQNRA